MGNTQKYSAINEVRIRFHDEKKKFNDTGLSDKVDYNQDKLLKWKTEYAYRSSIPGGFIHLLKRKKANGQLRKTEDEIRKYYPIEIWTQFSEGEQKGRKSLNEMIDKSLHWIGIQKEWNTHKNEWNEIESDFLSIQNKASDLNLSQKADIENLNSLSRLSKEAESKKKTALIAAEAWKAKKQEEQLNSALVEISQEFQRLLLSNALLDSWMNSDNQNFAKTVLSLTPYPTKENVVFAQRALNTMRFDGLISLWKDAIEAENKYQDYSKIIDQIPTDKARISAWWNGKPSYLTIKKLDTASLPQQKDILWDHLNECNKIASEWKECNERMLSFKMKEMQGAREWAIKNLTVAMNKVPEHMGKNKIKSVILPLINESVISWPVDDLTDLFVDFDPERIKGEIKTIDSELEILSFDHAKAEWEERVKEDRTVLDSIEDLYTHYRKTKEKVKDSPSISIRKHLLQYLFGPQLPFLRNQYLWFQKYLIFL